MELESQPLRFIDRELLPLLVHTTREVAKFVKAPPTSITLHNNVTTALNVLIGSSIDLPAGSRVLRLNLCYGAVKKMLDARTGIENVEIAVPLPLPNKDVLIQLVRDALETGPFALAVFDHIASNSAIKLPIRELTQLCHAKSVRVLIDGAHSLGSVRELELVESGVDYFVSNAHKWLCNPKGAAMMYVAPAAQATVKPIIISHGTGSGYTSDFIWTGCQDYATILTFMSAIHFWNQFGLDRCIRYSHTLVLEAGRMLAAKWNTELLVGCGSDADADELTANMLCIRLPGPLDPADDEHNLIQNTLHFRYQIEVPIKVLGSPPRLWVRISSMIYNSLDEYERLADVMLQIRGGGGHAKTFEQMEQEDRHTTTQQKQIHQTPTTPNAVAHQATGESDSTAVVPSSSPAPSLPPLLLRADHTQIGIPPGCAAQCRAFYVDFLGMVEVPRPVEIKRVGFWLYCGPPTDQPHANVHVATEDLPGDHYARSSAHIAYSVQNLAAWRAKLTAAGIEITPGLPIPAVKDRFDIRDPFGNRIELIEYKREPILAQPTPKRANYFWHTQRAHSSTPLLRVGVFQGASVPADIDANLLTIRAQCDAGKKLGAELILFPELFLTGYALSRGDLHRSAIAQTSGAIARLQAICVEFGIAVCVGYPERAPNHAIAPEASECACCTPEERACVYNSAILVSDKGEILQSYRKTHLYVMHINTHTRACACPAHRALLGA